MIRGVKWIRVKTKGRKELLVALTARSAAALGEWKKECRSLALVFPALRNRRKPFAFAEVGRRLVGYAKAAGIGRHLHLHLLRHSHAFMLAEAGVSIDVIKERLGHADIQTTQRYARMSTARVRAAVERVFDGRGVGAGVGVGVGVGVGAASAPEGGVIRMQEPARVEPERLEAPDVEGWM